MDDTDERLKIEADDDGDLNPRSQRGRILGASRRSREVDDRGVTENREMTDDDRLELFRKTHFNDVLPDIPKIPGYHVCWLSTNHPNDSIAHRMRLGYEMIKAHEIQGMEYVSLKTGEYSGGIGINEMVAFKISDRLYQAYMHRNHHELPAEQAGAITAQLDAIRDQAHRDGGDVLEGDGMAELRRSAPARGMFSD